MNKPKVAAITLVAGVTILSVACLAAVVEGVARFPAPTDTPSIVQEDVEDCDLEDWMNREDDCGFIKPSTRKAPSLKAPAPRTTRR